ncbi:MAG: isoprenyl transferase [Desulfarculaceae bacterium]
MNSTSTDSKGSSAPEGPPPPVLPDHVAIIMDGNGRWAKERGWRRVRGHEEGAESVRVVVRTCRKLGISALTLYAFSEENWSRPRAEIKALMTLLERFLRSERQEMLENGIRLNTIGETSRLPGSTQSLLKQIIDDTAAGDKMVLTLALSYGGRQEIVRAARRLCSDAAAGRLSPEAVDEQALAGHLYTAGLPDPDLLIRTSGELRTSNFLLWQMAYTEFYFTNTFWPDFRKPELMEALWAFSHRQRRFGKTGDQLRDE